MNDETRMLIARARDFVQHPNVHFHYKDGAEVMAALADALEAASAAPAPSPEHPLRDRGEPVAWLSVDELAQIIRTVDGSNSLGAGALAEAILASLPPARVEEGTEADRFPKTLGLIHAAIDGYVTALVAREHGAVAQYRAFKAICEALGRSPLEEMATRGLE